MDFTKFFEPEEAVGKVWHGLASRLGDRPSDPLCEANFADMRSSLSLLFRALGGAHSVELAQAPAIKADHKITLRRAITQGREMIARPTFDGERLLLPATIGEFSSRLLNRAAYFWLTASAAQIKFDEVTLLQPSPATPDSAYLKWNIRATQRVAQACPGLREAFADMCRETLAQRIRSGAPLNEMETCVRQYLKHTAQGDGLPAVERTTTRIPPVAFWLDFQRPANTGDAACADNAPGQSPSSPAGSVKRGQRRNLDQADRKDSFIMHRFESILSWAESMNINRSVDDDDEDNARKASDDQDTVTLSRHHKKAASRLHLHLELSPSEAEHERIADQWVYPEWNFKSASYLEEHCRILETQVPDGDVPPHTLDRGLTEKVRRQFEVLRSRREQIKRQTEGPDLDLDALIHSQAQLRATGQGSDRIYLASRNAVRDLSVALLLDTSRSTESDMGGACVLDVSRKALSALAHGLNACGDRFAIWGFSSLKRQRVFVSRCKGFDEKMSATIDHRIASLKPGHYTRLGAAIRHAAARLVDQPTHQRLLLLLTDGKPNDTDHYEGKHGIEDSRMAVREARRMGLTVHGIVIDEDGQDWFARIFGRGGFTLLPHPKRLLNALPQIYRSLTQEF